MNPRALRLRNYRTFEELDLDLPAGCVAIVGANGAGKSSLANVVDLALFGPEGRSWAPYLTQGAEATEMMLELVFEHAGELYRVRRGFSGRGKGKATLDLEVWGEAAIGPGVTGDHWMPLTREKIDATQELVEQILGLTRETFRASAMLVQGDGAAFTEAQPRERKAILGKILGLERFERLQELVRRDTRAATSEIDTLNGGLQAADRELSERENVERRLAVATSTASSAEIDLAEVSSKLERAAKAAAAGDELRRLHAEALAVVANLAGALRPLEERRQLALEAEQERGIADDELSSLATASQITDLERRLAELEGEMEGYRQETIRYDDAKTLAELRSAERDAILGQARDLNEKAKANRDEAKLLEQNGPGAAACEVCGQTLGAEALASTLAHLRTEADELDAAAKDLEVQGNAIVMVAPGEPVEVRAGLATDLSTTRRRLEEAREHELQRARLEERIRALDRTIAAKPVETELEKAALALTQAKKELEAIKPPAEAELDVVRADALALRGRVEEERIRLQAAEGDKARASEALERLDRIVRESEGARGARDELLQKVDRLAILDAAYGRDGIPSLIVQNVAIPSIETEACRILAELGTSYRVELRTEKALAGGGTAEALDVVIETEEGERPYETFSGGERTRINLALRIALARLLAHRRGAESRLLVIDEPEYLDAAGTAALASVLEGLGGDFERVYLISHVPDLRDSFDQTLEVVRNGDGRSAVVS